MLDQGFYKAHLERVSRSFAFCIAELNDDLRDDVALAYLLFRVLDTIEDSTWQSVDDQSNAFRLFNEIIQSRTVESDRIDNLIELLNRAQAKPDELLLAADMPLLANAYIALEFTRRGPLQQTLRLMNDGMKEFAIQRKHQIKDLTELDRYCYIVAGCIGEMLTAWTFPKSMQSDTLMSEAVDFGVFLQKINILKDLADDSRAGRNFVFSWDEVVPSLEKHLLAGYEYIKQIPVERNDYRIFCAWSLFLGIASYPYIEKSFREQKTHKISRFEAKALIDKIKKRIVKHQSLDEIFDELRRRR